MIIPTGVNEPGSDRWCEADLAKAIMDYLLANPFAMDTLVGIAEWWVPPDRERLELSLLKKVLDEFISQGKIEAEAVKSSGEVYYRLPRRPTGEERG